LSSRDLLSRKENVLIKQPQNGMVVDSNSAVYWHWNWANYAKMTKQIRNL
jgi:hypothetical protein